MAGEHFDRVRSHANSNASTCPSTGLPAGACPGYRKDHFVSLACGGRVRPPISNGRPSPTQELKDKRKRRACVSLIPPSPAVSIL